MLRLFRARASCLITAVLLTAGTTGIAFEELLHAGTPHDVACVSLGHVAHDASSHRFRAPASDVSTDDHCIGCHLARAPRLGTESASGSGHVEETSCARPIAAIGSALAAALDNLPPRSPPRRS